MLDQVPPELVTRICEHACKPDLYSVVQVSQRCHKLAAAVLYRHISLSSNDLQSDVTRWTNLLERTKLWNAPRCVAVANSYSVPSMETTSSLGVLSVDVPGTNGSGKEAIPKLYMPLSESEDPIKFGSEALHETTKPYPELCQTDSEAVSLAAFLPKLSSLGTLIWYSDSAPAPSLALLLQNELSGCSLHMKAFSVDHMADLEHMRKLVTLRNLRCIWFLHTRQNRLRGVLQRVMKYRESALEEVRMVHSAVGASPFGEPSIAWNDQDCEELDGYPPGRVSFLQLAGLGEDLRSWTRCIDFSYLRHLSLESGGTRSDLEMLLTLQLGSLDSLAIVLDHDETSDTRDQYYSTLRTFMCSLRPLSRLRLAGTCEASHLKSILEHHAVTLKTLYLLPFGESTFFFTASTVALVTETCKEVVELGITMRRHWDKPAEAVTVLNAIGSLPRLSDLNLILEASSHDSGPDLHMMTIPEKSRDDRIRDGFKNSAIDADLAKAVFNTVVSSATKNLPGNASDSSPKTSRLRYMSLAAEGGASVGGAGLDMSISAVVEEVGRRWIVERPLPNCDANVEARRDKAERERTVEDLDYDTEAVFRSVWPDRGGDCFHEWHAFPLNLEERDASSRATHT